MVQNGRICQAFDLLAELHRSCAEGVSALQSPLAPSLAVRILTFGLLLGTFVDPVPILLPYYYQFQKPYSLREECGNEGSISQGSL